jgi:5-methylcytosine-specific restriction endonuclease McrA
VDHKVPVVKGGKTEEDNLALACSGCNGEKGCMDYDEYKYVYLPNKLLR